ncbi:MAG TPA: outer membrane lipoprotein carrier protein LolA [Flavipsychrobacter sp.]|jgi:outer membrane lipoprotein-sorting protein|nr:outer membrane lipoprotein carrier protein LolA [Flavipsychrobacter sp.]
MKKLILLAALAISMVADTAMAQDAKAKAILDAASKKMNGLKSLKANFSLSVKGANAKTAQSKKGSFMMKGVKYRVTMGDQEIICDGKTQWTFVKQSNEVQVSNYNPSEATVSPTKLFTNFYDKEYTYTYGGSKTFAGKSVNIIEMVPKSSAKQFKKVLLAFDKSNTITGGEVFEKNGNQYHYEVSGFTPNAAVTDASFIFDTKKHPGVEVVDLR